MNEKVKTITVVILLSFTCFLTQCKGCLDVDNATNKLVPDQVLYTVSCGFPAPYFDVEILNSSDESYYYRVKSTGMAGISTAVNVAIIIALYALIMFLLSKKLIALNRFLNITLVLVLLFSSGLLVSYFPGIIQQIALYLYLYPVMAISNLLKFLKLDAVEQNMSPRIYLVLLIIIFYFLVPLAGRIKRKFSAK